MAKVRVLVDAEKNIYEDRENIYNISIVTDKPNHVGMTEVAYERHRVFVSPEGTEVELGKQADNGSYKDFTEELDRSLVGRMIRAMVENKLSQPDPKVHRTYTMTVPDEDNEGQTKEVQLHWGQLDEEQKVLALQQLDAQIIAMFNQLTAG